MYTVLSPRGASPLISLRVIKVDSLDGDSETHFIIEESEEPTHSEINNPSLEGELKRITKKDASKPLLLTRR
jgi:hypothetical protein